jgi:hypothetical protein
MGLEWSFGNVAWLFGTFLLALAPAVLFLLTGQRRGDPGGTCRRKRYRPD